VPHAKHNTDDYLFAYLSVHDDEDAPDGAWWAKLEDGVTYYNEQHGETLDPHETVHAYLRHKGADDDQD